MKIWFDILFSNWWMFIYCEMDSGDCVMKRVTEWEEPTLVFCSCNSRYDGEDGDSGEDSGDHLTRTVRGPGVRRGRERTTSSCPPPSSSLSLLHIVTLTAHPEQQVDILTFILVVWQPDCGETLWPSQCYRMTTSYRLVTNYSTQFPSCASDGSYICPVLSLSSKLQGQGF